jgi:hypothetical protein
MVKRTEKGNPSTDKDAMVLLSLHAKEGPQTRALRHLVRWRKADKMINTWAGVYSPERDDFEGGFHVLEDGRLHASWKNLTTTGRLASGGPNMQNFNIAIQKLLTCEEEADLVGLDLSQAELRVMAYLSSDKDLLYAYRQGLDVHTINTTLLFECRNPGANTNPQTEKYLERECLKRLGVEYESLPVLPPAQWKSARTLGKNFVFGDNYGAMPETLFDVLRSKRDPETDEPLFPDLELGTVEACKLMWEQIHPAIPNWWASNILDIETRGYYRCPVSGRIRWFRGGFKRNELLNTPIQTMVASHMNRLNTVCDQLQQATGDESMVVVQVHDMVGAECLKKWTKMTGEVMFEVLSAPFDLPNVKGCVLPPDKPKVGRYLNEI